jgi:glycosyltransferase involved in cell wall biosynthesis
MVLYDPQEFGGLEEYAVTLAIGLLHRGHQVSVLSATWVTSENQYMRRLRDSGVTVTQVPKWLSYPAFHWATKEKILEQALWLFSPLIALLAGLRLTRKRDSWQQSFTSARHWLRGQLTSRFIGPDRRKPLARLWLDWWRLRWRPDLLHIHGYTNTLLFAIEWAHARRIPVVYEEHQTPDARFDWWLGFEQTINQASVVVAVSETSAQALRTVCRVTQPIAVRSPLLPDPIAAGWQRDIPLELPERPIRVTTVARLVVAKGLDYLLDAIALVRAIHPTAQFNVYGEGPLREELLARAKRLGLDGNAIFVGAFTSRAELARIMAQTDIFVMSSILEGQPLSLVEAMAYGCPIVATTVGGIPEIIRDDGNGLLCAPRDPQCLAQKISSLINDAALRARLGQAARKSYEQSPFQPDSVCERLISLYDKVLRHEDLSSPQKSYALP